MIIWRTYSIFVLLRKHPDLPKLDKIRTGFKYQWFQTINQFNDSSCDPTSLHVNPLPTDTYRKWPKHRNEDKWNNLLLPLVDRKGCFSDIFYWINRNILHVVYVPWTTMAILPPQPYYCIGLPNELFGKKTHNRSNRMKWLQVITDIHFIKQCVLNLSSLNSWVLSYFLP